MSVLYMCATVCVWVASTQAYRAQQHTCVDIPQNFTLCKEVGYDKMRVPNLLEHETLLEATQQAQSWVPLMNVHCHADTQLFLCSLFSPVCLDRPIYPCRSLCQRVRGGCEARMITYGYPWPQMFNCDNFPQDNDMCINSRNTTEPPQSGNVESGRSSVDGRRQLQIHNRRLYPPKQCHNKGICHHVETYENILDNYCTADFVIRTRFKKVNKAKLNCKKVKVLKKLNGDAMGIKLKKPTLILDPPNQCCEQTLKQFSEESFLVMGNIQGNNLVPRFIMQWRGKKSKVFKRALRTFKNLNCTDLKLLSRSVIGDVLHLGDLTAVSNPNLNQKDIQFPFTTTLPQK